MAQLINLAGSPYGGRTPSGAVFETGPISVVFAVFATKMCFVPTFKPTEKK
jgi:hypothetical protein